MEPKLIRIDRNGSKYYEGLVKCDRCGGDGIYKWGAVINGHAQYSGVCFKCNGAGKVTDTWIERTTEYKNTLAVRRRKRHEREEAKRQAERDRAVAELLANKDTALEDLGFRNGKTYVVTGNTYTFKDMLKDNGAKYTRELGWHFSEPNPDYPCIEICADEVVSDDVVWEYGKPHFGFKDNASDIVKAKMREGQRPSEYIGEVGQRITVDLTLQKVFSYDTDFGYRGTTVYVNRFTDAEGNTVVWKTSSWYGEEGKTYTITGTIKEHEEYREEKQTVLTRCKIKED